MRIQIFVVHFLHVYGAVQCSVAHVHCHNRARGGCSVLCRCKMGICNTTGAALAGSIPWKSSFLLGHSHGTRGRYFFGRKDGSEVTAQQDRVHNPECKSRLLYHLSVSYSVRLKRQGMRGQELNFDEDGRKPEQRPWKRQVVRRRERANHIVQAFRHGMCDTKESGTHGIEGNGGNEVASQRVNNVWQLTTTTNSGNIK